jgi:Zn-finger nucleic acid-binding protein
MKKVRKGDITADQCPVDGTIVFDPGEFEVAVAAVTSHSGFRHVSVQQVRHRNQQHYGHGGYQRHSSNDFSLPFIGSGS